MDRDEIGLPQGESALDRLIAEGRATRAERELRDILQSVRPAQQMRWSVTKWTG